MVLYYSATGNTEFIARQLAEGLGDDCVNLLERIRGNDLTELVSAKPFVICTPIYVCEAPRFLMDYLKRVRLSGNRKAYFVFTSGGYSGIAGPLAGRLTRKKGMEYMGRADFTMPRNYIISRHYPMLPPEENRKRIHAARARIPEVVDRIRQGLPLKARHVWLFELLVTLPFNPLWVRYRQSAGPFHATDRCVGCGKCARLCPIDNIALRDGRPTWRRSHCAHCMACIENCPVDAIEYGDITRGIERYRLGKYVARDGSDIDPQPSPATGKSPDAM